MERSQDEQNTSSRALRAIGQKKAQEVIKRVISNYNSISEKLGVDDEQ